MSVENVNTVVITGNLTRDPELRHLDSGTAVCKLRVAVNSRRKDQSGNWFDKPNYFDVTVWAGRGKACAEYLAKGRPVAVEGRLEWREWEDQAGNKRQSVEIIASSVQFLGSKEGGGADTSGSGDQPEDGEFELQEQLAAVGAGASEEDIPF